METITLYDLNKHLRRVVALNFPDTHWVSCEIGQISRSNSHYYLTLVQKADTGHEIIAQSEAVLWSKQYRRLNRRLGVLLPSLLKQGVELRVQVSLDYHERYGLKLHIEDLDPDYTMGKLEQHRRQIIEQLSADQLLEKNGRLSLPPVLQRIAVVSSETAAGLQDFLHQLEHNPYGYLFDCRLFPAAVQGEQLEKQTLQQLKRIRRSRPAFDCVVFIRGGGSRLDLSGFDNLKLGRTIAGFPIPVLTGIGHDIDETIADLVAHTALKTPTAVADFLIAHNLQFEKQLETLGTYLQLLGRQRCRQQQLHLEHLERRLQLNSQQKLNAQNQRLDFLERELSRLYRQPLREQRNHLDQLEYIVRLLDPKTTLRRGYTLTTKDGRPVHSIKNLEEGDHITTHFQDGKRDSIIKNEK